MDTRSSRHIPQLDGLRGLAIVLVLAFHFVGDPAISASGIDGVVRSLTRIGWCGVDLFFVLSGFLITGILLDHKESPRYYQAFYARRILRIFPAYYAFLIIYLVLLPWLWPELRNMFRAPDAVLWLYLADFKGHSYPTYHFWSLAIEEQFYLVWPLIVARCTPRRLTHVCGLLMTSALLFRIAIFTDIIPLHELKAYTLLFTRWDALAAGSLLAVLVRNDQGRAWLQRFAGRVMCIALTAIVGVIAIDGGPEFWNAAMGTVGYSALACFFMTAVYFAACGKGGQRYHRTLRSSVLRFFGRYSYGLYIIHFPLRVLMEIRFGVTPEFLGQIGGTYLVSWLCYALLLTVMTILAALVSWNIIEQPILRLKRFVPYQPIKHGSAVSM